MKKEKMTMEKLAVMVKNEFDNVNEKMATKEEMRTGFETVNKRLDKIESQNLLIRDHHNKIERLEDNMRVVKTKLGIR